MNQTLRYSLIYGGLSAAVLAAFIAVVATLHERVQFVATLTFGYSVMLVAMSFVFVGVKRYRDVEGGGVIRFGRALGLGLLIALIACLAYVLIWEAYLAITHYRFMDDYIAKMLPDAQASGKSPAAIARYDRRVRRDARDVRQPADPHGDDVHGSRPGRRAGRGRLRRAVARSAAVPGARLDRARVQRVTRRGRDPWAPDSACRPA